MFAEVANYANDAGMFVFLLSCCFALPVRVPRGSDLPSEALPRCIREMVYLEGGSLYRKRKR
jgi:hypothetical protein